MATQKVSDTLIDSFPSSKLTGALPVIDGSAITGAGDSVTKSASDPAIDTNPSGGVSHVWVNTTSGEVYSCTDATTDANIWTNVGSGDGDIAPWNYGGSSYGFMVGAAGHQSICKFTFASSTTATDFGDLANNSAYTKSGHSDKDNSYGYHAGGYIAVSTIERFSMVSQGTSSHVGDLTAVTDAAGSTNNNTHAFTLGHGWDAGSGGVGTMVQKFAFASSAAASEHGSLAYNQYNSGSGNTNGDASYGYMMGGNAGGVGSPAGIAKMKEIQKISLNSASTSTVIASTTLHRHSSAGSSSSTHGYSSGGHNGGFIAVIDKFSFATEADATGVGDMASGAKHQRAAASALDYGYNAGGGGDYQGIDRINFSQDGNSVGVGNLSQGFTGPGAAQV